MSITRDLAVGLADVAVVGPLGPLLALALAPVGLVRLARAHPEHVRALATTPPWQMRAESLAYFRVVTDRLAEGDPVRDSHVA